MRDGGRAGRSGECGSNETLRCGSSGGVRRMCPSHLGWARKMNVEKRSVEQRRRISWWEMRLIYAAGIFKMRRRKRACAASIDLQRDLVNGSRWRLHLPLFQTKAFIFVVLSACESSDCQTSFKRFYVLCIVPIRSRKSVGAVLDLRP